MFSISYGLLALLEESHVTGNIFLCFMCSLSLLYFAGVWLLGLLLSKCWLCTLCLVLQDKHAHPDGPRCTPLSPVLDGVFVLRQALEAYSCKVLTNEARVISRFVKPRTNWDTLSKTFFFFFWFSQRKWCV